MADQRGSVAIFDIATDNPTLIGDFQIPETLVLNLDYDAWSGHGFLTNSSGGMELAVDGTVSEAATFHHTRLARGSRH